MDSFTREHYLLEDNNQTKLNVLRREWLSICGVQICYTLSIIQGEELRISIGSDAEIESVFVRGEREATDFFELLVRNSVTPCALRDVFEDIFEK